MIPYVPNVEQLLEKLPQFTKLHSHKKGGFKIFYPAERNDGTMEALKLAYVPAFDDIDEKVRFDLTEEVEKRLQREIGLLGRSKSQYIVKLGNLAPTSLSFSGFKFIAYTEELLIGDDLHSFIQKGKVPDEKELRLLATCIIEAIKDLWFNLNTVHRDIKPLNVIKTNDSHRPFIVLDLGLAFSIYESALTIDPHLRFPPPGTTRYLAPEMLNPNFRDTLDYRSDLYAMGITLFEYAAGIHPLARNRDDLLQTLTRIIREIPKPLEIYRSDLSKEFTSAVNQLLKKMPALRPANLTTLKKMIGTEL
ncbi:MAG: protein kinase [Ignavibacteriae bacterium]|nr:protein kinase [Ignavibacteriota bacterium]